jgi:acyl carrier protein
MSNNDLIAFLKKKIEEIAFAKVSESDELLDSGILDSVNVVELSVEIENALKIKIPFEDINRENFNSVNTISDYIAKLQS